MDSLNTVVDIADKISGGDPLIFLLVIIIGLCLFGGGMLWRAYYNGTKEYQENLLEIVESNVIALQGLDHHMENAVLEMRRVSRETRDEVKDSEQAVKTHVTNTAQMLKDK